MLDQCERSFPWWAKLSPARQQVIASMGYQMGMGGKFVITFEDMEKLLADAGEACFFRETTKR